MEGWLGGVKYIQGWLEEKKARKGGRKCRSIDGRTDRSIEERREGGKTIRKR